ncbi:MAG: UDP-3-O-(3-hydroxymyristoyl)glucosamine N-acyltransferase [Akkermansiaceae bacterium]|nr:UDP-3-O-(3-hydroxymyristoyl)glucosamine N-acyltransferase [Akkermansiaceae bacterium]
MELRIDALTALVGGKLLAGDGTKSVSGVAGLADAGPADLSFFNSVGYRKQFEATRAGAVLVTPGVEKGPDGVALIEVENPSYALAMLAREAEEAQQRFEPGVHPTAWVADDAEVAAGAAVGAHAVVESGAVIGEGTGIGPGTVVGRGVKVGRDCRIMANVTVRDGCILGDRVVLQPGVVIGSDGYGYEYVDGRHERIPQIGIVVLEDEVEVGANTTIDRARFGKTLVGAGTKIDNLVQVAHNVQIGKNCLIVAQAGIAGSARIGNNVIIAAQSGVNGHKEIADGVQVGGGSAVYRSIHEAGRYMGTPARPVKDEMRLWSALEKLVATTREVDRLRKEVDSLKGG